MAACLDYVVVYVDEVTASVRFYEAAFGLGLKHLHESGQYAELDTGAVTLAFCAHPLAKTLLGIPYHHTAPTALPPGCQVSLTVEDVAMAYEKALEAGAIAVIPPEVKPWGFEVAFVRDNQGFLVELCRRVAAT